MTAMGKQAKDAKQSNKTKEPVFRVVARVSLAEMAALLESPELKAVEEPVAAARGLPILAPRFASDALNDVCHVGWDAATIRRLLAEQRDLLVRLILADHQDRTRHVEEEEYPDGEVPRGREKPVTIEVLGLTRGFALSYLNRVEILRRLGKGGLRAYLKHRRASFAQREATRMEALLRQAERESL
jgi:hypothetical protein